MPKFEINLSWSLWIHFSISYKLGLVISSKIENHVTVRTCDISF